MLWRATVQREDPAKPVGFSPQRQQAQAGDALFWFNEDSGEAHQPVPDSGSWNIPPIGGGSSSDQLSLPNPGLFAYHCANHPDETGSIIVANAVLIAAGANPLFGPTQIVQGQAVSWGNADADAHRPAPVGGEPWCADVPSGALSAPVDFPDVANIDYHCALHPDNPHETGSIAVARKVVITAGSLPNGTITAGQGVAWQNDDGEDHQPAPDSGDAWLNNPIAAGTLSTVVTFSTAGSVPYHCALHPTETGTIDVLAG